MKDIFYPTSVAVVGVSSNPENLGRNIMLNLIDFGFTGVVYPVGPRGGTIAARRIYESVSEIPDEIDSSIRYWVSGLPATSSSFDRARTEALR